MEDTLIGLIQTVGLPIVLVLYYLFIEKPRQRATDEANAARYDALVDKLVVGQKECADTMHKALDEHNGYIEKLIKVFDQIKIRQ